MESHLGLHRWRRTAHFTARSTHSIKSPTKRPRSRKPGAPAGDNYCFVDDRLGGCHRRKCPWECAKKPNRRASNRGGDTGGGSARNHGAGSGDRGGAYGGNSGQGGRGSGGNNLPDGGSGGGGRNNGASHSGGGPTRTLGHGLCHTAGPTSVGPQRASSVGDAAKEGTRSAPNTQEGVVESLNACDVALQQLSHATDSQPTR